jgi:hypothetical protein
MLEDDGFVLVGRVSLEAPSTLVVHFDRDDAKAWGPALYAFRIGGEVVRLGKTESKLKGRMVETERLVSRAMAGNFQLGGTNPWEAFEWRRRLTEHGSGELLARPGPTTEERALIRRYDPPLCDDSPCARLRPPDARGVRKVVLATAYWRQLNDITAPAAPVSAQRSPSTLLEPCRDSQTEQRSAKCMH